MPRRGADGDAHADVAFTFTFSEYQDGAQTGTAWYATGEAARSPEPAGQVLAEAIPVSFDGTAPPVQAGPVRLLTGRRSDPFFADIEGTLHGFAWTGHDDFAGNNVDSIALEVPAGLLGDGGARIAGADCRGGEGNRIRAMTAPLEWCRGPNSAFRPG